MKINLSKHIILKSKVNYFLTYYQQWENKISKDTVDIGEKQLEEYSELVDKLLFSISTKNPQVILMAKAVLDNETERKKFVGEELEKEQEKFNKLNDEEKTVYLVKNEKSWKLLSQSLREQAQEYDKEINEWDDSDDKNAIIDGRFIGFFNQEIIKFVRQLAESKQELADHEKLLTELAELKTKLANIETEAQSLQGDNSSAQTILNQLEESKKKLQEYETKEQEFQTKISQLEKDIEKEKAGNIVLYQGSNKRISELTTERNNLITQKEQLVSNWNEEKESFQLKIINLERELNQTKQKLEDSEAEIERLRQELQIKETEINQLNEQIKLLKSEIQELTARISQQEQQIQHLEQEKNNYETEKQSFTQRIEELKTQLNQNLVSKSELENLKQEKVSLERKVKDCETRINDLNNQISEQKEEIQQQKQQLTNLESDYFLCQQEKNALTEQVNNLTKQISGNNSQKTSSWWNWQELKNFSYRNKSYFKWGGIFSLILLIGLFLYKKTNSFLFSN